MSPSLNLPSGFPICKIPYFAPTLTNLLLKLVSLFTHCITKEQWETYTAGSNFSFFLAGVSIKLNIVNELQLIEPSVTFNVVRSTYIKFNKGFKRIQV